jgi:hypothetical protein
MPFNKFTFDDSFRVSMVKKHIHFLLCMSIYVAWLLLFFAGAPSYSSNSKTSSLSSESSFDSFHSQLTSGIFEHNSSNFPVKKEEDRDSKEENEKEENEKEEKEKDDNIYDAWHYKTHPLKSTVYSISFNRISDTFIVESEVPYYILFHSWKHFLS